MGLSSNSLIHLTEEKESLIGILKEDFIIKYCREIVQTTEGWYGGAVPMVSFCDIPLSQIKKHINSYGKYGIGLKKEWALRNGLNPVLYIEKESHLAKIFRIALNTVLPGINIQDLSITDESVIEVMRFSKNYQGRLVTKKVKIDNYRFSDEREWRYVPDKSDAEIIIGQKRYIRDKETINESISHLRLRFEPNDISYIIINDEDEISEFVNILRTSKRRYSLDDVERLTTRIITTEQILSDF